MTKFVAEQQKNNKEHAFNHEAIQRVTKEDAKEVIEETEIK